MAKNSERKMYKSPYIFIITLFVSLSLLGCQANNKPVSINKIENVPLTNTYWKVITLKGNHIVTPENTREMFLQFKKGDQVHGFTGCNHFQGTFIANEASVEISGLAGTMKLCHAIQAKNEATLFQTLKQANRFKVQGETLQLFDMENKKIAHLNAVYF